MCLKYFNGAKVTNWRKLRIFLTKKLTNIVLHKIVRKNCNKNAEYKINQSQYSIAFQGK